MKFYTDNIGACISLVERGNEDVTMIKSDLTEIKIKDYYKELKDKKKKGILSDLESKYLTRLKSIYG